MRPSHPEKVGNSILFKNTGDPQGFRAGARASYRPDIDGLRAIAILGVLAYHLGLGLPGGYGGVDVFFVISGFLIAGIVGSELEAGTFSVATFYVRRIRRILPALAVCLVVTTIAAVVVLFPSDIKAYGRSLLAAVSSTSNIYFAGRNAYFDTAAIEKPLLHTWSLSVEEQFYLVFPLALSLLFKFARTRVRPILIAVTALSFAYSSWSVNHDPQSAFFSTPGRAWELGLGVLLALGVIPEIADTRVTQSLAIAGAAMIAAGFFLYDDATFFPGLGAVPFCLGALLIILAGQRSQGSVVTRLLSSRAMTGVGLISYSVYLWHWPLLVLCQYRLPGLFAAEAPHATAARLLVGILSICIGTLSWRFVEVPLRKARSVPAKLIFGSGAVVVVAISVVAVVLMHRAYWVHRWPASIEAMQTRRTTPGRALGLERMPGWPRDTYLVGAHGSVPDTVLWGDSFAQALIPGFIDLSKRTGHNLVIAADPGCPPLLGVSFYRRSMAAACKPHNDAVFKAILGSEYHRVILVARWSSFAKTLVRDDSGNPVVYGKVGRADGKEFAVVLETLVRRLIAENKDVVLVGPIPSQPFDVSPAMSRHIAWGMPLPPALTVEQFYEHEKIVLDVLPKLATLPHVHIVYPHTFLCGAEICRYSDGGKPM
jgi:peptidoglycan/LPS O-acetylase OafA/YrhL